MSTFKRVFMIAYLVCSLAVLVLFALALLLPGGAAMMAFLHGCVPLAVLLVLVLLVDLVGLVAYTGLTVLTAITRGSARLRATESGEISIEKSALVSTASRALEQVSDMTLQGLTVDVLQRGDTAVIDARVTATPLGTDSLMALAGRIQATTKRALEAFTEHEVRYVAVNFVEPRRRGEQMGAGPDPDLYESPFEAAREQAAQEQARRRDADHERADAQGATASFAEEPLAQEPAVAEPAFVAQPVPDEAPAKKPSLWERAKAKASGLRSRLDAEDVVETHAEVVSDATPAAAGAAGGSDDVPGAWDAPVPAGDADATRDVDAPRADVTSGSPMSADVARPCGQDDATAAPEAAQTTPDGAEPTYETDESSTRDGSATWRRDTL